MNERDLLEKFYRVSLHAKDVLHQWILNNLPKISDNWLAEFVFPNISPEKERSISNYNNYNQLDFNDIIAIITRNWFILSSKFNIPSKERENVRRLQTCIIEISSVDSSLLSKQWALETYECLHSIISTFENEESDFDCLSDLNSCIMEFHFSLEKPIKKADAQTGLKSDEVPIKVGTLVSISGNSSKIGAVINIEYEKYQVLINNRIETYYKEQIEAIQIQDKIELSTLCRVKTALTAHQICNPGSSNLYSLNTARIDFVPYQFRPALKLISSDDPKILIADDVGVGKTIEAGLILKELEARSSISSVLIICPRPLVAERKWETEMKRFDESFVDLDGPSLREAIYEMHRDNEWPERYKKVIIPYSLFKSDIIEGTKSTSGKTYRYGLRDLDQMPHFDLVIVDEAHTIRNPSTYAYEAVEMFCSNADAVVFLTATPLQNKSDDLFTLLNLLRPDLIIDRGIFGIMSVPNAFVNRLLKIARNQGPNWQIDARQEIDNILSTTWGKEVIQHNPSFDKVFTAIENGVNTRDEKVELITNIESLHTFNSIINRTRRRDIEDFCIRRSETIRVNFTPLQQEVYTTLIDFELNYLAAVHGTRNVKFMMCTLLRQASSCIIGLIPFIEDILNNHVDMIREDGELLDYDVCIDEIDTTRLRALSKILSNKPFSEYDDPKFDRLLDIINQKQNESNKRVIIFSTFRNTLRYVNERLSNLGIRIAQIDGSVPDDERYEYRRRFAMESTQEQAIDVLLLSEVGCEGLDYQFCDTIVNYDLPWNPMRIEQRIGRIDRRGQKSDTVRIHNLITEGTIDADVYDKCLSKIGVFEDHVGDCAEILGNMTEQIMQIMFDSSLTDKERTYKIEKIADNDILRIQEMRRLEQSEKSLYGFDLSEYMQNQMVQKAENDWINANSVKNLVNTYLSDNFPDSDFFKGKGDLKTFRTTIEMRQKLLEDLKCIEVINENSAYHKWVAYLKSNKPNLSVTFDNNCAKENRDATFLTPLHPLVRVAAKYENSDCPMYIGVEVVSTDIEEGLYPFQIYSWKYVGLKPDIELIAISENDNLDCLILDYIQSGVDFTFDPDDFKTRWEAIEQIHYTKWKSQRDKFINETNVECEYRIDQLNQSFHQREKILNQTILSASEERIARMRKSQLDKLVSENLRMTNELKNVVKCSDIHTNLQISGVLKIINNGVRNAI